MSDFIVGGVIVIVVVAAVAHIIKEKKKGSKCIGCSQSGFCTGKDYCAGHNDSKDKEF